MSNVFGMKDFMKPNVFVWALSVAMMLCATDCADGKKAAKNEKAPVMASVAEPKVSMTIFMMSKCPGVIVKSIRVLVAAASQ